MNEVWVLYDSRFPDNSDVFADFGAAVDYYYIDLVRQEINKHDDARYLEQDIINMIIEWADDENRTPKDSTAFENVTFTLPKNVTTVGDITFALYRKEIIE